MALSRVQPTAIFGPNVLVIGLPTGYNWVAESCEPAQARVRIETALGEALGRPATFRFEAAEASGDVPEPVATPAADDLADDPLVRKVVELFEARRVHVENEDSERA